MRIYAVVLNRVPLALAALLFMLTLGPAEQATAQVPAGCTSSTTGVQVTLTCATPGPTPGSCLLA